MARNQYFRDYMRNYRNPIETGPVDGDPMLQLEEDGLEENFDPIPNDERVGENGGRLLQPEDYDENFEPVDGNPMLQPGEDGLEENFDRIPNDERVGENVGLLLQPEDDDENFDDDDGRDHNQIPAIFPNFGLVIDEDIWDNVNQLNDDHGHFLWEEMNPRNNVRDERAEADGDGGNDVGGDAGDDDEREEEVDVLSRSLRQWACQYAIKQNALDDLLSRLRLNVQTLGGLPRSSKTLLKTPLGVETEVLSGQTYFHFGLQESISSELDKFPALGNIQDVKIAVNIDGLPLFKSSTTVFWPILGRILNLPGPYGGVFPITLTCGPSKPTDHDFLLDTIEELHVAMRDGIVYRGRNVSLSLCHIICDAPARADIKAVQAVNGYYGCDRCTQEGVYYRNRVTFPIIPTIEDLRDDRSFREQTNPEHHHGISLFTRLRIDMVKDFTICSLHQVYLGVVKRLLLVWLNGPIGTRLTGDQVNQINGRLEEMSKRTPTEFQRKPRALQDIGKWKGIEFRFFLLYSGPIVLKGVIREELYTTFLCLSCGISLLSTCPQPPENMIEFAHRLLVYFVEASLVDYGQAFVVYCVHVLVHLADEVRRHGSLDSFGAWAFENFMQIVKKCIRSGRNPVVQTVKRLHEIKTSGYVPEMDIPLGLATRDRNNCFLLDQGVIVDIVSIRGEEIVSDVYVNLLPFFDNPCDSRHVRIYFSDGRKVRRVIRRERFMARCLKLVVSPEYEQIDPEFVDGGVIFIGLNHSLNI